MKWFTTENRLNSCYKLLLLSALVMLSNFIAIPFGLTIRLAQAQTPDARITITNESQRVVCSVYISPTSSTEWGQDRLVASTIEPFKAYTFTLSPGHYNLRLEECGGVVLQEEFGINLVDKYELILRSQNREGDSQLTEARTLYEQGDYQSALQKYLEALDLFVANGDLNGEATALNGIAEVYVEFGQREQALGYFEQALSRFQEAGSRAGEGVVLDNIGRTYYEAKEYDQALNYYAQALDIVQSINDIAGEAALHNNIGAVYYKRAEYDLALEHYLQALPVIQELHDRRTEATILDNLGVIYRVQGDDEQALSYYQSALDLHREVHDRAGEAITLTEFGRLYEQMDQSDQAIEYYRAAIDIKEDVLSDVRVAELQAAFAAEIKQVFTYGRLIDLLWQAGRYDEAFNYVERARARSFLNQLGNQTLNIETGPDGMLATEHLLRTQLYEARTLLEELSYSNSSQDIQALQDQQDKVTSLEAEYARLLVQLQVSHPEDASLVSITVPTLSEVQELLDENTTLLEYFILTDEQIIVFIITRDQVEPISLTVHSDTLTQLVNESREFATLDNPHPDSFVQLHELLIEPLLPSLKTRTVGIVPHGILHYVPFSAMTDGSTFLADRFVLFTLPSASVLPFIQNDSSTTGTILVAGNPDTTESSLPFAEQEAQFIADLYNAEPLTGITASESVVRAMGQDAYIVHLAAHATYNSEQPLFSTIYLAADDQNDGRLEVHEIYSLDWTRTDLVVLSACETQLGEVSAGDDIVALNRAFFYAGAQTVVSTLWEVDDQATLRFMELFYGALHSGMGKAEALRSSQVQFRLQYPEYAHPYFWSAFVLSGNPGALQATNVLQDNEIVPEDTARTSQPVWPTCNLGMVPVLFVIGMSTVYWRRKSWK